VIAGEGDEIRVDEHNVLEIVDDRFAVKEIVCNDEKVPTHHLVSPFHVRESHAPIKGLAPLIALLRTQLLGALWVSRMDQPMTRPWT